MLNPAGAVEIDLRGAEIGLPPPDSARSAMAAALDGPCGLSVRGGSEETREQLSAHLTRWLWDTRPEHVVVTAGASGGLSALLLAWTSVGDVVLVPDPGYPAHRAVIEALGRRCRPYPMNGERLDRLADLMPTARMIIWNSPHNPTGTVPTADDGRSVARMADRHGVYLVSDEVNHDLTWERVHVSALKFADPGRSAGLWSASKSLRMAGLRVGCVATAAADRVARASWALTMGTAASAETACVAALRDYEAVLAESRRHAQDGLAMAAASLGAVRPVEVPQSGLCLWWNVRWAGLTGRQLADLLYRKERVRIWPGERFGSLGAGYVRINAAVRRNDLTLAMARLLRFFDSINHPGTDPGC